VSTSAIGSSYSAVAGLRQAAAIQAQNAPQKTATQSAPATTEAKPVDRDRDGDNDKGRLVDIGA